MSIAEALEVDKMPEEDGALLLLRRAKILPKEATLDEASTQTREQAKTLCLALDGLPLALNQAGAFIEKTDCGLVGYLELYRTRGDRLLAERGQVHPEDHPASVATTWSLSFERVEQASPAAAELLRLCAFLHADEIPEEIFTEGGEALGPVLGPVAADPLEWNRALGELLNYSLLQRNADIQTLDIHRLVQVVLKAGMDETTQGQWAERAVRAVNSVFPSPAEFSNWPLCERLLPQALRCAALIEAWGFEFEETGWLLGGWLLGVTAYYLMQRTRYEKAEPLYRRALAILEKVLGPEHPDVVKALNNLALVYRAQGRYEEAEPLFQRALAIAEKALGPEHPNLGGGLSNLATLYRAQGRDEEAEPLLQRALAVTEKALGSEHPNVGTFLNNLAALYDAQGRYEEAEPLYQQALAIGEKTLGPEHPDLGIRLNNLAALYDAQGRYEEAEPLLQRALTIAEKVLGPEHPTVAIIKENYALLLSEMGRNAEASAVDAPNGRPGE
jgi:tetratricopeptide (TPR) repeat protein